LVKQAIDADSIAETRVARSRNIATGKGITSANVLKIEQYYEYAFDLLARLNQELALKMTQANDAVTLSKELSQILGQKIEICDGQLEGFKDTQRKGTINQYLQEIKLLQNLPHEYWENFGVNSPLLRVLTYRRIHDTNGILGSAASLALFALTFADVIPLPVAIFLLLATRVSAMLSASIACFTNQNRLGAYKDIISGLSERIETLAKENNPTLYPQIDTILEAFSIKQKGEYEQWIKFTFRAALRETLPLWPLETKKCIDCLKPLLEPFCEPTADLRKELRTIVSNKKYAVLDALAFLHIKICKALIAKKRENKGVKEAETLADNIIKKITQEKSLFIEYLRFYVFRCIIKDSDFSNHQTQLETSSGKNLNAYFEDGQLNLKELTKFCIPGNPHDENSVANVAAQALANECVHVNTPSVLVSSSATFATQNPSHEDTAFYPAACCIL